MRGSMEVQEAKQRSNTHLAVALQTHRFSEALAQFVVTCTSAQEQNATQIAPNKDSDLL